MTDLRSRAERLADEYRNTDNLDVPAWADDAAKIIRDLIATLPADPARVCRCGAPTTNRYNVTVPHIAEVECCSIECCRAATAEATEDARTFGWVPATEPDPAPTGERRPCAGWREHDRDCYLLDLGVVKARVNRQSKRRGIPVRAYIGGLDGRSEGMGEHDDRDTLMLSMEDAAAELLRAGLRALGCK